MLARDRLELLAQTSRQVDQNVAPGFTMFFPAVDRR
jgi:hypothetical protein